MLRKEGHVDGGRRKWMQHGGLVVVAIPSTGAMSRMTAGCD